MPVIGIPVSILKNMIGKDVTSDTLVKTCQEMGCGVEDLTRVNRVKCNKCDTITEYSLNENVPVSCDSCNVAFRDNSLNYTKMEEQEVIRLDLLADRPDNFDAGGLSRSIKGYLGLETGLKEYKVEKSEYKVLVDRKLSSVESFRPYIACAVLKNLTFTDESLKSLMKLQENLHWALGRNRKIASIGVYDLSTISEKIAYTTIAPSDNGFTPLGSTIEMMPSEILEKHPKGVNFSHLLKDLKSYPLLIDDKKNVLSMPPIINSEKTRVTINSIGVFIDVTGIIEASVNKALNIIVTSIKEWNPAATIHSVEIVRNNESHSTPVLASSNFHLEGEACRELTGVHLSDSEIVELLRRMRYTAHHEHGRKNIQVEVPCYRNDIMHEYDLIEDVAIAYGFHNIKTRFSEAMTIGTPLKSEVLKEKLRNMMTGMGFLEVLNIMLTSEKRAYENLGREIPENCVQIENPISLEQTIVRTDLITGILETIANNTANELPQKIFEIGNVIFYNPEEETGAEEVLNIAAGIVNTKIGFADIKANLNVLLREMNLKWSVEVCDLPFYLKGRSAEILVEDKHGGLLKIGHIGEIHPLILEKFHIPNPVVFFELVVGHYTKSHNSFTFTPIHDNCITTC